MTTVIFSDIRVGDTTSHTRTVTRDDIAAFAKATGDDNPVHLSDDFAAATQFGGVIAHGMMTASFISAVLGTRYPGQGSIFMGLNDVKFLAPVRPGDTITTTVTVTEKHAGKPIVKFDCACINQRGETVLTAAAVVRAPTQKPVSDQTVKP